MHRVPTGQNNRLLKTADQFFQAFYLKTIKFVLIVIITVEENSLHAGAFGAENIHPVLVADIDGIGRLNTGFLQCVLEYLRPWLGEACILGGDDNFKLRGKSQFIERGDHILLNVGNQPDF